LLQRTVYFRCMMDRRLHVLRVVDQLGTITAAAGSLHLTPSAVSQQLRGLAHELDVTLLEADGRRVRLTPTAHALLRHADELAARWERARGELAGFRDWAGGLLRLGGFPSSLDMLVIPAAEQLRRDEPRLDVRIVQVETADALDRLLVGEIDVAVVMPHVSVPPADDPRFELEQLIDDPLDLIVPVDHPLAGRDRVALEEVAQEPWVLAARGACDQHDLVAMACMAAGFTPKIAHEVVDWPLVASLVGHGFGVSLKPRLVRTPDELPVRAIPLAGPNAPRRRIRSCIRRGTRGHQHIALGLHALERISTRATAPQTV
jgi:DNA-binding transcriptional LysR family regulator